MITIAKDAELPDDDDDAYRPSKQARYHRRKSSEGAEITTIPDVVNPRRKQLCKFDLLLYLQSYFPHSTGLSPFSPGHIRAIERIQRAILDGGYFLQVVFRGWAKSTITEGATAWGVSYGHCHFPVPIAADAVAAKLILDSIKAEFETNDLLYEDFPEICHPVRALEGKPQRCKSQTYKGERTYIEWTAKHLVLPKIPGSLASCAVIKPRGIESNIRGIRHKRSDGVQARPDLILLDDPQTDESARSPDRVAQQLTTLNKAILRLGGHKRRLAAVCNATIIETDDMIDQLADAKKFPAWQTERIPMLKSFAKCQDATWLGKYAEVRNGYSSDDPSDQQRAHSEATELYRTNRTEYDEGAEATWLSCFEEDSEISAIQHAYNIIIDTNLDAFMAECQNSPIRNTGGLPILTPDQICAKQSPFKADQFPAECTILTSFVDVHPGILYYQVWAWDVSFSGYCILYGTFPDQHRKNFSHQQLSRSLRQLFPGMDTDATVQAGLDGLIHGSEAESWPGLLQREWIRADGVPMKVARCGIDANGEASDGVKKFIRNSPFAASLYPSYGKGVGASATPISRYWQNKGKPVGPEWMPVKPKPGEPVGLVFDTNYWKTRFHRALSLPLGARGSLCLFKDSPQNHRQLADQWYSEFAKEVTTGNRTVYEFKKKAIAENHYLDVAVGCMVAASRSGIASVRDKPREPKTMSLREMAAAARK